eukprot:COSAG06_NODE_29750_length_550_cov_9.390244_1_plen_63_part_00
MLAPSGLAATVSRRTRAQPAETAAVAETISTTELAARLEWCAGYLGGPHGSPAGLPRYSPGF